MKFTNLKLPFFILALLLIIFTIKAQDDCGSKLVDAQKLYRQGIIEEIPQMLKPCIETGFTRIQRNEAYKILILTYLFDGDQLNAENTMIEFLKKNPEYEIMPNDPVEFVSLFETFRTLSVFSFGLKFGPNFTNARVIEHYSALNLDHTNSRDVTGGGYHVGLSINRYIARRIFLNLGLNYIHSSYKFIEENVSNVNAPEPMKTTIGFKESLNRYELPLSVGYEFEYSPFNYILSTGASIYKIFKASGIPEILKVPKAEVSMTDYRKSVMFSYHISMGLKYKVPRGYLAFDMRYQIGINNIVNTGLRWKNPELLHQYNYVDDDFALNSFSISFGYYFSFYQPKKR